VPTLTRQQLEASLKEGTIAPLYLLCGVETYLLEHTTRAIAEAALKDSLLREFNESRFSLLSGGALDAIAAAEQFPMMSERRVVYIQDFSKLREADEVALKRYIENPVATSVVIFIAPDLDKRRTLARTLLDRCVVVECQSISDADAKRWAQDYLRSQKVTADDQVLTEIIALVGTDIQTLKSELDKLATAAFDSKRITQELVDSLIGRSRELSNFALTDHLIARNRKKALEVLYRLLQDDVEPLMLIGLIAGNYHRLALAKDILKRHGRQDVFKVIRMPYNRQSEYISMVQRSSEAELARGIQKIAAADLAIKTSLGTPRLQLEMLVCELAG
jgi:DNA polymerase-3 subunit delta